MNNIEALINNAQQRANQGASQTANAQQETMKVAAGQDFHPQTQTQAQPQTQTQAPPQTRQPVVYENEAPVQYTQANVVHQQAMQQQMAPMQAPTNVPAHLAVFVDQVPGGMISMETAQSTGIQAEDWLKFSYFGIALGSAEQKLLPYVVVDIDMQDGQGFMTCEMVKFGNSPTTYIHTYDRKMGSDGRPWLEAVQRAYQQTPPNAKSPNTPYPAVQLPMTLAIDAVDAKGEVVKPKGTQIGYTTAKTAWHNWSSFYRTCQKNGLLGQVVRVKIENDPTNVNDNKWGVPKFTLLGLADALEQEWSQQTTQAAQ